MSRKVADTQLYDLLEIKPDATETEIKKAFRKLALIWHPDKWANTSAEEQKTSEEKFKEISEASEILSSPEKRQIYDEHGLDALRENNGHQHTHMNEEMIREMFGQFMPGFPGQGQGKKKEPTISNIDKKVSLTLKEIFTGTTVDFEVPRYSLKKNKQPKKEDMVCSDCKGAGMKIQLIQVGPGMMQQARSHCKTCEGVGIKYPDTFFDKKVHKFTRPIPKGVADGQRIVIENEGHELPMCFKDQFPGQDRTNINLIVDGESGRAIGNHRYMRGENRSPNNLRLDIEIQPHEALCGTYKYVPFVNDEHICIKIPPGIIFRKGSNAVVVPKMGMPYYKKKGEYGDLFVALSISDKFNMSHDQLAKIWKTMTNKEMSKENDKVLKNTNEKYIDSMYLDKYLETDAGKKNSGHNHGHHRSNDDDDSDDEGFAGGFPGGFPGGMPGQATQCQTQ